MRGSMSVLQVGQSLLLFPLPLVLGADWDDYGGAGAVDRGRGGRPGTANGRPPPAQSGGRSKAFWTVPCDRGLLMDMAELRSPCWARLRVVSWSCGVLATLAAACSSSENSGVDGAGAGSVSGNSTATGGTSAGSSEAGSSNAGTAPAHAGSSPSSAGAGGGGSGGGSGGGDGGTPPSGGTGGNVIGGGTSQGGRSAEATCARWKADTANLDEGTWSGSVDDCTVGDISADGRDNALRLFNLVRWLADLPAVVTEEARNQQAQACALMMEANMELSHEPPTSWKCYSEAGAKGASTSNISSGPGVSSVLGYMVDDGNLAHFGHRRIILGNGLGPIGLGSTGKGGASCMQNIGGKGTATKEWTAWPSPGPFPVQAYADMYRRSLDTTGWSIQSKKIDLGAAQVSVTSGGQSKPVKVEQLSGTYGDSKAIRIAPDGWKAETGASYSVSVSGTNPPIAYEFQLVDCQ